ncbi:hypothetical protein [Shinella zoogloeoides]|uniref:hypothetical protein n=1 Tax=Shinella zoogloeoides TaxID=352475 RepID=UPI0028B16D41|nr:hypothetical protein [Shinella zoogloeoides]
MSDQSTDFAAFLIDEYRDIPERHRASVVRDRFPSISHEAFMRGFAIAEEIAVDDAREGLLAA